MIGTRRALVREALSGARASVTILPAIVPFAALAAAAGFAAAETRARAAGSLSPAWYFGYALLIWLVWMVAKVVGVVSGGLLTDPARHGLDGGEGGPVERTRPGRLSAR